MQRRRTETKRPATTAVQDERHDQDRTWLWFAVFVGPLAWSADFGISYALTGRACSVQSAALLLLFSAVAFAVTLWGLVTAVRAIRELPQTADAGIRADPTRFMALSGIDLSGGFLLAIVAAAIPRLMVHPCA